jgi:hypothetical protein
MQIFDVVLAAPGAIPISFAHISISDCPPFIASLAAEVIEGFSGNEHIIN